MSDTEWWIDNTGVNLLGVDENGRDRLPENYILDFLTRIPAARESYLRLAPQLSGAEQLRLEPLYKRALVASDLTDAKVVHQRIQTKWNRAGVHTSGPRGGQRIGGN